MNEAEEIRAAIESRFEAVRGRVRIQRERRLWLEVELREFRPLFDLITGELGFDHLSTISGTDEGEELGFIYHLARPSGVVLSLMTKAGKNEEVRSVGDRFPGGVIYERELVDLFGARIAGLPPGPRYPLPDDWPACEYPLLKSWRRDVNAVAARGGGDAAPPVKEAAPGGATTPGTPGGAAGAAPGSTGTPAAAASGPAADSSEKEPPNG